MTTSFWVISGVFIVVALLFVIPTLLRSRESKQTNLEHDALNISVYRDQLTELDRDLQNDILTQEQYHKSKQVADLLKVASGRVWTGTQAKDRGLVDVLGNFEDALTLAATKAGVMDDYKVRYYPVQKSFLQEWLSEMEENSETKALKRELGEHYKTYEELKKMKGYQGSQARMPFELTIQ